MVLTLFYLGSKPVAVGLFATPWDKVAHGMFFSTITALLWLATRARLPWLVVITVILVGGLDELHQATLPGRAADWADFMVDVLAALGTTYLLLLHTNASRPPQN
jgi:VanZ family protein